MFNGIEVLVLSSLMMVQSMMKERSMMKMGLNILPSMGRKRLRNMGREQPMGRKTATSFAGIEQLVRQMGMNRFEQVRRGLVRMMA